MMMNGIAKQAAFYRGYLADERSLVPLTILLAAAVPLWLLVYLVGAVADTRQDTGPAYAASESYIGERQAAGLLVRRAALSPCFPVPLCDDRKQKDASMPHVDLKIGEPAASEIFDALGPRIRFLTAVSNHDDDYCLIAGVVPSGVVVPVHSIPKERPFMFWKEKLRASWTSAAPRSALAARSTCRAGSGTLGATHPARPPKCCA
jgi:hypothetical protein